MRLFIIVIFIWLNCHAQTITIKARASDYIRLAPVPNNVKQMIDSSISSKTGVNLFQKYFLFDSLKSGVYPGNSDYLQLGKNDGSYSLAFTHIEVIYYFIYPLNPWQKIKMNWRLDSLGNITADNYPTIIPDCMLDSTNCMFSVDSLGAISIAQSNGIMNNSNNCSAILSSMWISKEGKAKIFWMVSSIIDAHESNIMFIDIITGKVLFTYIQRIDF